MRRQFVVGCFVLLGARAATVSADDLLPDPAPDLVIHADISTGRRVLATTLAIVPGLLVRGTGSYVAHDRPTAKRLLLMAGLGLGLAAAGGIPVGVSGANPYLLVPFVPMAIAGVGLFTQSWLADVVHAAGGQLEGHARARPPWSLQVGTVWTHDAYRDRGLLHGIARTSIDRWNFEVGGWLDADQVYRSGDFTVGYRMRGSPHHDGRDLDDGSYLELRAAGRLRDGRGDHVQVATVEGELVGRLDFARIAAALTGTYGELTTGIGGERAAYTMAHQWDSLLLGRFTWGAYLGRRGELQLFYDHRRDTIAGGIAAWRAAGFVGSLGASVDLRVRGPWAMRAELEYGGSVVSTLAVRYQGGAR